MFQLCISHKHLWLVCRCKVQIVWYDVTQTVWKHGGYRRVDSASHHNRLALRADLQTTEGRIPRWHQRYVQQNLFYKATLWLDFCLEKNIICSISAQPLYLLFFSCGCNEQPAVTNKFRCIRIIDSKVSLPQSITLGLAVIKKRKTFFAWVFSELRIVYAHVRFLIMLLWSFRGEMPH